MAGDDRPFQAATDGGLVGKGTQKPNLGGRKAGSLHTARRPEWVKEITDYQRRSGVADDHFLAPGPGGAKGGGPGKDWDGELRYSRVPVFDPDLLLEHTVGGVFLRDEDRALYEEMLRLQGLGSNTETGVPYTEDEIMAIGTYVLSTPPPRCTHPADAENLKKSNKRLTKQVSMIMKLFRSDDKMSQILTQLESQPEFGSGSGSGGCGDDESDDDEDGGEDEDDKEDADS
ncbi:hypothetical protein Tco_0154375 [Tanacetum coccineum]